MNLLLVALIDVEAYYKFYCTEQYSLNKCFKQEKAVPKLIDTAFMKLIFLAQ